MKYLRSERFIWPLCTFIWLSLQAVCTNLIYYCLYSSLHKLWNAHFPDVEVVWAYPPGYVFFFYFLLLFFVSSLLTDLNILFHTYKTGPRQGGGGSNLKPPPQPRINPAPMPGTLLPGKSALVLFYLMYSCVQYEVLVIWVLQNLAILYLYLIASANHMF